MTPQRSCTQQVLWGRRTDPKAHLSPLRNWTLLSENELALGQADYIWTSNSCGSFKPTTHKGLGWKEKLRRAVEDKPRCTAIWALVTQRWCQAEVGRPGANQVHSFITYGIPTMV